MAAVSAQILSGTGALILPADSPYDRQLLIEHVLSRARRTQHVQVRVDRTTWLIEPPTSQPSAVCGGCTQRIGQVRVSPPAQHGSLLRCVCPGASTPHGGLALALARSDRSPRRASTLRLRQRVDPLDALASGDARRDHRRYALAAPLRAGARLALRRDPPPASRRS